MLVIPAIDIKNKQCVRLYKGDFHQKTIYYENPVDAAIMFSNAGFKKLHIVDLDGAEQGKLINHEILKAILNQTDFIIQYGGGIRSYETAKNILELGVHQVIIGTMAIKNPEILKDILSDYPDRVIVSLDILNNSIATHGWTTDSNTNLFEGLKSLIAMGIKDFLITDISKDGTLSGPNIDLYKDLIENFDINLIASGGVSKINDIEALEALNIPSVVVGKAIYEEKIPLKELIR